MTSEHDARTPEPAGAAPDDEDCAEAAVRAAWRSCFDDIAQSAGEPDALALAESIARRLRARAEGNVCRGTFGLYRFVDTRFARSADDAEAGTTAGTANVYPLRRR